MIAFLAGLFTGAALGLAACFFVGIAPMHGEDE